MVGALVPEGASMTDPSILVGTTPPACATARQLRAFSTQATGLVLDNTPGQARLDQSGRGAGAALPATPPRALVAGDARQTPACPPSTADTATGKTGKAMACRR